MQTWKDNECQTDCYCIMKGRKENLRAFLTNQLFQHLSGVLSFPPSLYLQPGTYHIKRIEHRHSGHAADGARAGMGQRFIGEQFLPRTDGAGHPFQMLCLVWLVRLESGSKEECDVNKEKKCTTNLASSATTRGAADYAAASHWSLEAELSDGRP